MVLESAPHTNDQVPMFTATLNTANGTIDCANATYLLPTLPTGGSGTNAFVLDVDAALRLGFLRAGYPLQILSMDKILIGFGPRDGPKSFLILLLIEAKSHTHFSG